MVNGVFEEAVNLVVISFLAFLIVRYYRDKTYAPAERYATFWPRFWTGSVDSLILWPISFITSLLVFCNASGGMVAAMLLVGSMVSAGYTVLMHARYGQTIGKMATGVRVLDFRTEEKITFRQALLREGVLVALDLLLCGYILFTALAGNLTSIDVSKGNVFESSPPFWIIATLPLLWFLAEILTMLTNEKRRALHDFIAGTIVVRTNVVQHTWGPVGGTATVTTGLNEDKTQYPPDYPIPCMCCGTVIPAFATACEKCGWSYQQEN